MLRSKSLKGSTIMMMMALIVLCLSIAMVQSSPSEEEIVAITNSVTSNNNNTVVEDKIVSNNNPVKITTDATGKSKIVSVLCPADHEMVYNFKASTLLGTKPHLQSVSAIKKGSSQENTLMGKMTLTCAGSTSNKNLIAVSFPSVQYLQFQGMKKYGNLGKNDVNFWFNKKYRTLQKRRNLTKAMNKYPLAIVRSKTGQVSKMIFHKREPFWLKSIKKGLVRVLTTETKKSQRKQTDGFGSAYTQKFNKSKTPKKNTQVIQKFSEKDFKKVAPKKRSIGYEGSHIVKINKKGLITRALMGTRITMGKRPALPSFKKFEKETGKKKKFVTKNKDQVQTLQISSLKLNKVIKNKKADIPKVISKFFDVTKGAISVKPQFIIIKTFGMSKQDRKDAKKMISKTFKTKALKKLLSSVKKDFKNVSPVTNKKLSKVAKYVSKSPVKASKVLMTELMKGVLALKKISPTEPVTKKIVPYIESVQSLIASVNNTKVQDKLAKISKIHPVLVKNYPYASILIKKPTKEVFTFLKNLKSNSTKKSTHKTNAFLAYADLADRSSDDAMTKEIIGDVMAELMAASSQESFLTAIHALNNAGKGVPLSIIKSIILSEKMPETIKNLVVENLKKRTSSSDIKVDELIHALIKNKKLSESVISSLISAQTNREGLIKNGTSIEQFAALLKKNPSELVKNAIKNYFYTVGSEESAKHLEQSYEQTTEMITQGDNDVNDNDVTMELNEEETEARTKVEQVADKIKSYFETANWNGAKSTCIAASKSEKMCIYNNEMLNFIKKQGDLSSISKAKFYSYENKFGTNGINIYTGFVVYGGASFDCSKDSAFDAVFFGRAAAEANLFDNTYPVASAYAELNNRASSSINNRVFVKLFTTTFVDKQFLPSVTTCVDETKNILSKSIPNLIKTSYTMTIGPVPITFSFGVGISYGVDLKYAYCLNSFSASLSLEPTLVADVTGSADIGIPLAKATISISASATSRGIPKLSFASCNLCASLTYKLESANFEANLKGKVAVWEKSWTLYTYSLPIAYSKTLYEQCVNTKLPTL